MTQYHTSEELLFYADLFAYSDEKILFLNWFGHQTGRTSAVNGAASKDDLIMVESRNRFQKTQTLGNVIYKYSTLYNMYKGKSFERCYVDCEYVSKKELETLFCCFKINKIIVLGRYREY